jgi:hypothetical protein
MGMDDVVVIVCIFLGGIGIGECVFVNVFVFTVSSILYYFNFFLLLRMV